MYNFNNIQKMAEKFEALNKIANKYTWQDDLMANLNSAAKKANSSTYALKIALSNNLSMEFERMNGYGIAKALTNNVYKDIDKANGVIKAITVGSLMQERMLVFEKMHRAIAGGFDRFSKLNKLPKYLLKPVQVELAKKYDDFIDTLDDSTESVEFIESVKPVNADLTRLVIETLKSNQKEHKIVIEHLSELKVVVQGIGKRMDEVKSDKRMQQFHTYFSHCIGVLGLLITWYSIAKQENGTKNDPQNTKIELNVVDENGIGETLVSSVRSECQLRNRPLTISKIIGNVQPFAKIYVFSESNKWVCIGLIDNQGEFKTGWIPKSELVKVE